MVAAGGSVLFTDLAPGRYKAYPRANGYVTQPVEFIVKPGRTAHAVAKLQTGQKITLRLKETAGNRLSGFPWVGYKITKLDGKTPVLDDADGPYTGDLAFLSGEGAREASFRVPPGTYRLSAVLRRESSRNSINSLEDLWSMDRKIKVVPGKNIVIEMTPKS